MTYPKRKADSEKGASLVEFAVLAPLLFILVFGIIEFGYMFAQLNELRHAAREGARYAAVDAGSSTNISDLVCSTMENLSGGMTNLVVVLTDGPSANPDDPVNGAGKRGDTAVIDVSVDVSGLSGVPLIASFLPGNLSTDVEFRLEQDSVSWGTGTATYPSLSC